MKSHRFPALQPQTYSSILRQAKLARMEGHRQAYIPVFGNTRQEVNCLIEAMEGEGFDARYHTVPHHSGDERYILVRF